MTASHRVLSSLLALLQQLPAWLHHSAQQPCPAVQVCMPRPTMPGPQWLGTFTPMSLAGTIST